MVNTEAAKHCVKVLAKLRDRIHPKFDKLITSFKSATTKDFEFSLDKLSLHSMTYSILFVWHCYALRLKVND